MLYFGNFDGFLSARSALTAILELAYAGFECTHLVTHDYFLATINASPTTIAGHMLGTSQLIYFTGLSKVSRSALNLRVGLVESGLSPSEWISRNTDHSICDLKGTSLKELFGSAVSLVGTESPGGSRWVRAFTADDLYLHARNIYLLQAAVIKTVGFLRGVQVLTLEHALELSRELVDVHPWINDQFCRFASVTMEQLLRDWCVLVPSAYLPRYVEYENVPIYGLDTALALTKRLNKDIVGSSIFWGEPSPDLSPAFYAVRLEDLPATVADEEYQEGLLQWAADKTMLPPGYTLGMIAEGLSESGVRSSVWANLLMEKTF